MDNSLNDHRTESRPEIEALRLLSASLLGAALIGITLGFILVFLLSDYIEQVHLFTWLALLICVYLVRLIASNKFNSLESFPPRKIYFYLYAYRAGALLSGLLWGWSGYVFLEQLEPSYQVYISFMLGGLLAGATTSLAADKYSIVAFFVPIMCPHIFYYITMNDGFTNGQAVGVGMIFFTVFLFSTARTQGQNLLDNYDLRLKAVRSEQQVKYLAYHDALTGLPNRTLFNDRLRQSLIAAKRNEEIIGMLFIDLDGFKQVNDAHGHDIGDALLKKVSARIKLKIRHLDTLSRIGGDEFLVLLPEVTSVEAVLEVAEKVRLAVATPFQVEGYDLHISSSIGVTVYPEHGDNGRTLQKYADIAMYQAKELGKNKVQLYTGELIEERE